MKRMTIRSAFVLGVCLLASPALAVTTLTVTALGLNAPNANYGCPVGPPDCLSSLDFQLAAPATATGTITINNAGNIASLDLNVASVTFGSVPAGGADAVFTNVHYLGSVNVISSPTFVSQFPPGPGPGSVSGLLNSAAFTSSSTINSLNCSLSGATGQCGFAFGPASFEVSSHNWLHTFVVFVSVAVPEPSLFLLALLGLAVGVTRSRS